jgi:hypothetical protein
MAQGTAAGDDGRWTSALRDLWSEQSQWSQRADELKGAYRSWTGPLVVAGFIGVVLSTLSPALLRHLSGTGVMPVLATIAGPLLVAVSAVLTRQMLGPKSEQQWVAARAVAEALKGEGYIYATGAPPYADTAEAPAQLAKKIGELTAPGEGIAPLPEADPRIVEKYPHAPLTADQYIAGRAKGQITYHQNAARRESKRLGLWRGVAVALAVVSAVLGVIAGVRKSATFNVWVAVVSTAIATVTALVYAGRFEFFATTYWATAQRLANLIRSWNASPDHGEAQRGRFVLDCEAVLAAQNHAWAAELSKRVREEMKAAESSPPSGA